MPSRENASRASASRLRSSRSSPATALRAISRIASDLRGDERSASSWSTDLRPNEVPRFSPLILRAPSPESAETQSAAPFPGAAPETSTPSSESAATKSASSRATRLATVTRALMSATHE